MKRKNKTVKYFTVAFILFIFALAVTLPHTEMRTAAGAEFPVGEKEQVINGKMGCVYGSDCGICGAVPSIF